MFIYSLVFTVIRMVYRKLYWFKRSLFYEDLGIFCEMCLISFVPFLTFGIKIFGDPIDADWCWLMI